MNFQEMLLNESTLTPDVCRKFQFICKTCNANEHTDNSSRLLEFFFLEVRMGQNQVHTVPSLSPRWKVGVRLCAS
jgi:hypothetical protein